MPRKPTGRPPGIKEKKPRPKRPNQSRRSLAQLIPIHAGEIRNPNGNNQWTSLQLDVVRSTPDRLAKSFDKILAKAEQGDVSAANAIVRIQQAGGILALGSKMIAQPETETPVADPRQAALDRMAEQRLRDLEVQNEELQRAFTQLEAYLLAGLPLPQKETIQ
jgi:hypothetical protein